MYARHEEKEINFADLITNKTVRIFFQNLHVLCLTHSFGTFDSIKERNFQFNSHRSNRFERERPFKKNFAVYLFALYYEWLLYSIFGRTQSEQLKTECVFFPLLIVLDIIYCSRKSYCALWRRLHQQPWGNYFNILLYYCLVLLIIGRLL